MTALTALSVTSLALALLAIWHPRKNLWTLPFAAFVVTGLAGVWITPSALLSGSAFAVTVAVHANAGTALARTLSAVVVALGAFALGLHLVPGFENAHLLADARWGQGDDDWRGVRVSADKPLVGLCLLLAHRDRLCRSAADWRRAFAVTAQPTAIGIGSVYVAALALGYVVEPGSFSPSLLPLALVAFARNLLYTVVAEEMLFRQVVQARLQAHLRGTHATAVAVVIASALFGAVHLSGGWELGLLAALAGAVYGHAFATSGRIETAIAAHALLNVGNALFLEAP